jgi:hypothetical protein
MKYGYFAALFVAGVTVVFVLLDVIGVEGLYPVSPFALGDAAIFRVIAWGIQRASRVAACAGLALYLAARWHAWSTTGEAGWAAEVGSAAVVVIVTLFFVHGIRGAFAVHKYRVGAGADGSASAV